MIELWLPVILGGVIVVGMVAARVWTALLSEGLPLLRDWLLDEHLSRGRWEGTDPALPARAELADRVQEVEARLRRLESLLESGPGPRL